MKKNLWIWALAAFSMAACTSEDVPTQEEQVVTENDFESPDGRVVVQLGAESSPSVTVSRAPIEGSDITALEELGIFAINRGASITSGDFDNWPNYINNCLLKNVKAKGTTNAPLDAGVNKGKRLTLFNADATAPGYVYYYPIQGSQNYDFYGYQPRVDGNNVFCKEGVIKVSMDLSNADVDLITGEAAQAKEVSEDTLYVTEATEATPATKGSGKINGYNSKYVRKIKYSNWIIDKSQDLTNNKLNTAEKDPFIPNISFKHRLTKLNFQIITAKEQAGGGSQSDTSGGDREDATELRVSDVILDNVPCTAELTIGRDMPIVFGALDESVNMVKNTGDAYNAIWDTNGTDIIPQNYENETYISAGYVMVAPTTEIPNYATNPYQIKLKVKSTNSMGIPQTQDVVLDLKKDNQPLVFEAGKSYNIRIALYALQEVNISAELTPWDKNTQDAYIPVE